MEVWIAIGAVLLIVIAVAVFVIATSRSLKRLSSRVDTAWNDITVQLAAREELLPQLERRVRAFASHEEKTFAAFAEARQASSQAETPEEVSAAENRVQGALRGLFAASEGYPQLQSSREFLQLQSDLVEVENRIQASRRFYNGGVREYNTKVKVFPNNLVAGPLHYEQRTFFEVADRAAISQPPRVQF
ncbi:LemA family protein [Pseudoclavibacter helvolus]|uniref:LemA family protein n=1 Tax=Pseudoclavibacter helvolus TaxID=255205 RepID=UPI003C786668